MITDHILIYLILLLAASLSYLFHKLTLVGAVAGLIISISIALGTGYLGISLLAAFFILASLATKTKRVRRTAGQVVANGGIAAILGLSAFIWPQKLIIFQIMLAGSLASATADTLSSELGTVYGTKFFNILNFKADQRGLDGVISLEGTLIGIAGATVIACTYCYFSGWNILFAHIIIAGFVGNIADSVLGATLESKGIIGNNTVNFLNTAIGAIVCLLLFSSSNHFRI